jgi:hypothetical protein
MARTGDQTAAKLSLTLTRDSDPTASCGGRGGGSAAVKLRQDVSENAHEGIREPRRRVCGARRTLLGDDTGIVSKINTIIFRADDF